MKLTLKLIKALLVLFMLGMLASSVYITPVYAITEPIQIVKDISPGSTSSYPSNFVKFKSLSFFIADDGINGFNPWVTDGTPDGTHKIKDISTPDKKLDISQYWLVTATDNTVFFNIKSKPNDPGDYFSQVWETDGTEAGTHTISLPQNNYIQGMQTRGNDLFVFQGSAPARIYIYSGGNLRLLKTWNELPTVSNIYLGGMTVLGNNVFFIFNESSNKSNELWRSDGTVNGTVKIGSFPDINSYAVPVGPLVTANNLLFLRANGHIYQSTGQIGNLEEIAGNYSVNPYRGAFVSTGSAVFFASNGSFNEYIYDLYMTRGKSTGVQKLTEDIYEYLIPINGRLYFYSLNSLTKGFIGLSDGTPTGTGIFYPISGSYKALFYEVVEVGDTVYFLGSNPEGATEIWTSNSLQAGCQPIASLYPGAPKFLTRAWLNLTGSRLLFVGDDGNTGFELMGYKVLLNDIFLPFINR